MIRNLKKRIEEYEKETSNENRPSYWYIYISDYTQIKDLAQAKSTDGCVCAFDLVDLALMAGFMLGYEAAQKDRKREAEMLPFD